MAHTSLPVLDEQRWLAWRSKNRRQDARWAASSLAGVVLLAVAALVLRFLVPSLAGVYDLLARFVVSGGAIILLWHAWRRQRYGSAAVFLALAALHNPLFSFLAFFGVWLPFMIVAGIPPFGAYWVLLPPVAGTRFALR